jgi:CRISPR-associated protein Cas2
LSVPATGRDKRRGQAGGTATFLQKREGAMVTLITYDVNCKSAEGRARLRRIARECQNFGQRVQNSVFECNVQYGQLLGLKKKILDIMNKSEDSVRFYLLGNKWKNRVEHHGTKPSLDMGEDLLLV